MLAGLAIVLMINGVQVDLPAPAYLLGNYTFVPARAVFEKLGRQVQWDPTAGALTVSGEGVPTYVLTVGRPEVALASTGLAPASPLALPAAPRLLDGLLYVPVRAVTLLTGAQATWDPQALTVNLVAVPAGAPTPTEIGPILADPPGWAGKLVFVRGEYTGWQPDPFNPATSQGPPVTRSDWTLRDASGSLYCAGTYSLRPLDDLGRRLSVTAVVALADRGFPYLQVTAVQPLTGLEGVTRYFTTDRLTYHPGDTVTMQMHVANPEAESVTLPFTSSQAYDFQVRDAEGQAVWTWSEGRLFAQVLQQRTLAPGESYTVTAQWTIPAGLRPGLYHAGGQINRDLVAYTQTFEVEQGGGGAVGSRPL